MHATATALPAPQSAITAASPAPPEPSRGRRLLILAVCCLSMVVVVMDLSIVNVALPDIRRDLHVSAAGLQWTVDAYALVLAVFLVLSGSLADRFGRRRMFLIGLVVFGLGSLACALAPTIGWLVAARAAQAVGGTMMNPVAMAIVANTFTESRERARAIGVYGSMSGLALALGPVLGGLLVDAYGWRAVFVVNLPIVVLAVVLVARLVPESRAARARRFDPPGQLLVAALLGGVVFAVIEGGSLGWGSPVILTAAATSVASAIALVFVERRRRQPLLEPTLFRSVPFVSALVMAILALCGFQAFLFVITLYLQTVRGLPAWVAGLSLLPIGVLVLVLSPISGRMVGGRGPRRPLLISGLALAVAGIVLLWLTPTTRMPALFAAFLVVGLFLGFVNPPISNTAVSGMPRSMAGLAASLASAGRQTGTALGVAIAGVVVGPSLGVLSAGIHRGVAASAQVQGTAFTDAARGVWWMLAGLGLTLAVLAVLSTGNWARATARRAAAGFEKASESTIAETGIGAGRRSPVADEPRRASDGRATGSVTATVGGGR
ncbi:MFS transporter [Humibacter antri]